MKKGRWTFLIMVLALAFTAGCGTAQREPEKTEKEEEDKLQIGLSFDSFVIERWMCRLPGAWWKSRFRRLSILLRRIWM